MSAPLHLDNGHLCGKAPGASFRHSGAAFTPPPAIRQRLKRITFSFFQHGQKIKPS